MTDYCPLITDYSNLTAALSTLNQPLSTACNIVADRPQTIPHRSVPQSYGVIVRRSRKNLCASAGFTITAN